MRHARVLVITPHYAPDLGPSAPIATALCEDLQNMGYDITVVTGFPHYAGTNRYSRYSGLFREERLDGIRIIRVFVLTVPKGALWGRLLYHTSFNILSTLGTLRVTKPDIILAVAPSLWSGLPLLVKAIYPNVPFVYIVFDIYPDVLLRLGALKNQRLINLIERVENYFYERSVQVSVISNGFKENLMQKGVPEDKIIIIPTCVDIDFIRPLPRENELRERWGLAGKFVVLYAGNIGFSQGLDTVLKAAELLQHYPDIMFIFVGEGAKKKTLQAMSEEKRLNNVKFYPFQPNEYVPQVYALADISLVSLKRELIVESVPSKTYTIMASARPIVATVHQNTEVNCLLDRARCGLYAEPGNADAVVQAIIRLYKHDSLRNDMGRRARDFVVEHFSRQVAADQYHKLIQYFSDKGGP